MSSDYEEAKRFRKIINTIKTHWLLVSILISILIGFTIGISLKSAKVDKDIVQWLTLPGNLFIRSLELLIVPVVFVGVVAATGSLSAKSNLKITLICVGLCFLTHILATLVGLIGSLVLVSLSSKNNNSQDRVQSVGKQKTAFDIIADILRNLIPKNIIKATTSQELTRYYLVNTTNSSEYVRKVEYIDGTNILGVLIFALLIGLSASVLDKRAEMFREFFRSCNDVVILVLRWLILVAPLGIASLIIEAIYEVDDLGESFKKIGLFTGLCIVALLFYGFFVLALMVFVFTRKNPFKYYLSFLEPMLLAFASTSGAVCIHKSIDICENELEIDSRMARFTIPFYTTLQGDGSSIFIVMACAFLSNYFGFELTAGDYIVIIIMTSILCLCLPSVPSSSIVTILVVLNAINFTEVNIAILYTVEWLLDR